MRNTCLCLLHALLVFALVLSALGLASPVARAQDQIPQPRITEVPVIPPPIDEPICIDFCPPPVWNMDGLEIPYQRVEVTIADQVATTHVEQLFRNPNDWLLEGTYYFPLPPGAAVSQLTMWVDGVPIEAKLLGKLNEAMGLGIGIAVEVVANVEAEIPGFLFDLRRDHGRHRAGIHLAGDLGAQVIDDFEPPVPTLETPAHGGFSWVALAITEY